MEQSQQDAGQDHHEEEKEKEKADDLQQRGYVEHVRQLAATNVEREKQKKIMTLEGAGETKKKKKNILLAASGSVASIKVLPLVQRLTAFANVIVVPTSAARHFIPLEEIKRVEGADVFLDDEEWASWKHLKDPVLHIELRRWADLMVVAPLSANTLAKLANGLSDNLLTCVARAWDFNNPLLVAPAMNTMMWNHPFTARHLKELQGLGIQVIDPVAKLLACGDMGVGAMAEVDTIVQAVVARLQD